MKKILFVFIVFLFAFGENANSQCVFKKIKKFTKFAVTDNCSVQVDISTQQTVIYNRGHKQVSISFVKSGDNYYLFLFQKRQFGKKFEIHKDNTLDIIFYDIPTIKLYPYCDYRGVAHFALGSFYIITKEQLEKFSKNIIESVQVHFTSDKEISNSQQDEKGSLYIEYIMKSDRQSQVGSLLADCILSK